MRWARDVVAEDRAVLITSVPSLLTATTRVTVVGMDAGQTAVRATQTRSGVAGIVMVTLTIVDGDAAIATVISTTIGAGTAIGEAYCSTRNDLVP